MSKRRRLFTLVYSQYEEKPYRDESCESHDFDSTLEGYIAAAVRRSCVPRVPVDESFPFQHGTRYLNAGRDRYRIV